MQPRDANVQPKIKGLEYEKEVEEGKVIKPSARPFICCVKEYGVKAKKAQEGQWERKFRMFGTTIM